MKTFDTRRSPVEFYLDQDKLTATGKLPAGKMRDLLHQFNKMQEMTTSEQGMEITDVALDFFAIALYPDSLSIIQDRLNSSVDPVDVQDLVEIMQWLIGEVYGQRPTRSSVSSSDAQTTSGQSSTAGLLGVGSTL